MTADPLAPNAAALEFLLTRRSRPPRMLGDARPDRATLRTLLQAAARVPDHGKLEPWRFIVLERAACQRLAQLVERTGAAQGRPPERLAKAVSGFAGASLIVAVIASPKRHATIPEDEQVMSAAAACLSLVNAALASGWGACWLTGWAATDPQVLGEGLSLAEGEFVAGYVHIGDEARVPPDRPRPDIDAITTWMVE